MIFAAVHGVDPSESTLVNLEKFLECSLPQSLILVFADHSWASHEPKNGQLGQLGRKTKVGGKDKSGWLWGERITSFEISVSNQNLKTAGTVKWPELVKRNRDCNYVLRASSIGASCFHAPWYCTATYFTWKALSPAVEHQARWPTLGAARKPFVLHLCWHIMESRPFLWSQPLFWSNSDSVALVACY
jgi:hypothetical protein